MRTILLALATALVAFAAGCGGDGGDGGGDGGLSADEWASSFCKSGVEWQQSLESRSQKAAQTAQSATGLTDIREALESLFSDSADETDAFVQDIEGLGPPPGDDGEEIQQRLVDAVSNVGDAFRRGAEDTADLEIGNPQQFTREAKEITNRTVTEVQQIGDSVSSLDDDFDTPELDKAFDSDPACKDFESGGNE